MSTRTERGTKRPHSPAEQICYIDRLPDCVLEKIFDYFDFEERIELSLVSKRWMSVISSYHFANQYPLTFEHCVFRNQTEPKKTFSKTRRYRQFPCIQIGNVEQKPPYGWFKNEEDLPEFYKTMKRIGGSTTHVTLTNSPPPSLVLSCFPCVIYLNMINLEDIADFENIPETLETVKVKSAKLWVSCKTFYRIKTMKHLKNLFCTKLDVSENSTGSPKMKLFDLTEALTDFLGDAEKVGSEIEVSPNLLSTEQIDFEHVTGLTLYEGFEGFDQLLKFVNLKKIKFIVRSVCFNFHQEVRMESVGSFKLILSDENNVEENLSLLLYDDEESMCDTCFNNLLSSFSDVEAMKVTHIISDSQVKEIYSTYPLLKRLTLNTIKLSDDAFLDPFFGHLSMLEKVNLIEDRYSYYDKGVLNPRNDVDRKTIEILRQWPAMSNLRKLKLHFKMKVITKESYHDEACMYKALSAMTKTLPKVRYFSHGIKFGCDLKPGYGTNEFLKVVQKNWPKIIQLGLNITGYCFHHHYPFEKMNLKHLKYLHIETVADLLNFYESEHGLLKIFSLNKKLQFIHGAKRGIIDENYWKLVPNPIMYREMLLDHSTFDKLRNKLKITRQWLSAMGLDDTGNLDRNVENIRLRRLENFDKELQLLLREEFRDEPYTEEDKRFWGEILMSEIFEWDCSDYQHLQWYNPSFSRNINMFFR